jgi:hypothetical protein
MAVPFLLTSVDAFGPTSNPGQQHQQGFVKILFSGVNFNFLIQK